MYVCIFQMTFRVKCSYTCIRFIRHLLTFSAMTECLLRCFYYNSGEISLRCLTQFAKRQRHSVTAHGSAPARTASVKRYFNYLEAFQRARWVKHFHFMFLLLLLFSQCGKELASRVIELRATRNNCSCFLMLRVGWRCGIATLLLYNQTNYWHVWFLRGIRAFFLCST